MSYRSPRVSCFAFALWITAALGLGSCVSAELRESEEEAEDGGAADTGPVRDIGGADTAPTRDVGPATDAIVDAGDDTGGAADGVSDATEDVEPACLDPRTECGFECVDTASNINHCGACFAACLPGQVCSDGVCGEACGTGLTACGGACVDPMTSSDHCGTCNNACRADQACVDGACATDCDGDEQACSGVCVDPQSDRNHCGGCGIECPADRTCSAGRCACPAPQAECDGRCIDVATDDANCGACGTACDDNEQCVRGSCACDDGLRECGGVCVATEFDPTNCGACGVTCSDIQVCVEGRCESDCEASEIVCDSACVDPATSEAHCGRCGNTCSEGQFCTDGRCDCPEGSTNCGGVCRDLQSDPATCGACGVTCRADQRCSGGTCRCPAGLGECGGACIPFDNDPANCGACGVTCDASELCRDGACVCPSGTLACGAGCIDVSSDPANCGACGNRCADDLFCIDGACVDACPLGQTRCGTTCVDTGSDAENCGACDNACGDLEACEAGVCECGNDHLEPNGSLAEATVVARGDTVTEARRGSQLNDLVLCQGETDHYRIVAPGANSLIRINVLGDCEARATGLSLQLNSPEGASFASSNAGGVGNCPRLEYRTPVFGLHELIVSGGSGVEYALDIQVTDVTELTPGTRGEGLEQATGPISRNARFLGDIRHDSGFFSFEEDVDLFFVQFIEQTTFIAETTNRDSGCSFDSVLVLLDATGAVIVEDDDGGSSLCSRIERTVPPGNYYFRVRAFDGSEEFDYALQLTTSVRQEQEPNNTAAFANAVGTGSFSVEGAIQQAFDVDLFAFTLDAAADVEVYTTGIGVGCPTDTMIALYAAGSTTPIAMNDDTDASLCSRLEQRLDAGSYLLEVRGFSATRGDYLVNLLAN
jgi:hypothetical protein